MPLYCITLQSLQVAARKSFRRARAVDSRRPRPAYYLPHSRAQRLKTTSIPLGLPSLDPLYDIMASTSKAVSTAKNASTEVPSPPHFVALPTLTNQSKKDKRKALVNEAKHSTVDEDKSEALKSLRQRKAWETALGPAKNIPMQVHHRIQIPFCSSPQRGPCSHETGVHLLRAS